MTDISASWALHRAILGAVRNSESLKTLIGEGRVFDQDDKVSDYPHIRIGSSRADAWQSATFDGCEHEMSFEIWSKEGGTDRAKHIASELITLLHDADWPIAGHALVDFQFESSNTQYRKDKKAYQTTVRFKGLTVQD